MRKNDSADILCIPLDSYIDPFNRMLEEFPQWQDGMHPLYIRFTPLDAGVVLASTKPIPHSVLGEEE